MLFTVVWRNNVTSTYSTPKTHHVTQTDQTSRTHQTNQTEQTKQTDQTDQTDQTNKTDQTEETDQTEQTNLTDQTDQTDQINLTNQTNQTEHTIKFLPMLNSTKTSLAPLYNIAMLCINLCLLLQNSVSFPCVLCCVIFIASSHPELPVSAMDSESPTHN